MRAPPALLALLLSACAVGPNFHSPAAPAVSRYTPTALPPQTASAPVAGGLAERLVSGMDIPAQWWTLFHSQALDALVEQALRANPTLQAAQASLREARDQLYAGRGALYPSLSAGASVTREQLSGAEFGQPNLSELFTLNSASVSVSYLFDLWGGERRQIEALSAQTDYQRFELEASYLTLTTNVVAAAIEEASLRGQIDATEQIIAIEAQELAGQQREFASGAVADTAVLAQAAALAQTRAQLAPLQKQLAQTRDELTAYLGRLPSQQLTQTFELSSLQLPATLPVSLPSRLVQQRPDIRAAEALLQAASAQVGVATAALLPQLSLTGAFGSESVGPLFAPGTLAYNLGLGLTQPLFEGGKLYFQRRAAVDALQAAAAQYRQTVLSAFQNVADVLHALQLDAEELEAEAVAARAAADSLAASQRQFHVGAISYLSLLTAEQTYQQALLGLVQAQAARYADAAALFQALGGGWWNRSDAPQRPD
ncbi:MAG TPA: efflux transporter outer membrane subunit [Steroidobacteraceae bacterium]|nr:efflux transporter outer membrane subunit [Steroidobacteraceae bacterium]